MEAIEIGARLMVGFEGAHLTDKTKEVLDRTLCGSVILFLRNFRHADEARRLIEELRQYAGRPLILAVDQEGGAVVRLVEGCTIFPGNMALAAAGNTQWTREVGRQSGAQLRAIGFDMNLAPVVDLLTNPDNAGIDVRAFGSDPELAKAHARDFVLGHAESGVLCCLKHFPGLGEVTVDPHLDLPRVSLSEERFRREHLPVYEGLDSWPVLPSIMTSHVLCEAFDPEHMATLSRRIVAGLLREELGIDSCVLSDCLEMEGLSRYEGVPEAAVQAVRAGHDIVPICHRQDRQVAAFAALERAAAEAVLDLEEHRASLRRIDALQSFAAESRASHQGALEREKGDRVAARVADAAVHIFGDERGLLPVQVEGSLVLAAEPHSISAVEDEVEQQFAGLLRRLFDEENGGGMEVESFDSRAATAESLLERARSAKKVILYSWNARGCQSMREILLRFAEELPERLIVVHLRNPFDHGLLPEGISALTAFGYRTLHLRSLARVLLGNLAAMGSLPAPVRRSSTS